MTPVVASRSTVTKDRVEGPTVAVTGLKAVLQIADDDAVGRQKLFQDST
jgi:hypothetical protein